MVPSIFRFQYAAIRRNPLTCLLIIITVLAVLYIGYRHETLKQAIVYLTVMWLCSLFVDLYALWRPAKNDFPVRNPRREVLWFFLCVCLGFLFLYIRFIIPVPWQQLSPWVRMATIPLILFVYPIGLAIILLLLRYKPADLGIRLQGLPVIIPIILLCAITNRLVSPGSLTWDKVVAESGGAVGALFLGLVGAGLAEEFFRIVGQTRLGALLHNKGMGWFITTLIWTFMHSPKWYGDDHDAAEALLGAVRIIPMGLMWGYITHRTKSILPATLVHGTNVWELQNF